MRVRKLKNRKDAVKYKITGEMIKGGGLFHCIRVKERGLNVRIMEVSVC